MEGTRGKRRQRLYSTPERIPSRAEIGSQENINFVLAQPVEFL
jgi:hypothetical protein